MFQMAFALFTLMQSSPATPPDEIKSALAHAEALYYGARFTESIALLTRVDESLKKDPGHLQEKIDTKLRLALSHIGLNDVARAKSFLVDLYALEPNYVLDAKQFPPKVVSAAADAKAEQVKIQCFAAQTDARSHLEADKTAAFLDLMRSMRSKCAVLIQIEIEGAAAFYKSGMAAYKRGDLPRALNNLEAVLAISPEHELATQYVDLIHNKQKFTQDRRKALSTLVDTWNRNCPTSNTELIDALRRQMSDLLPDPAFGQDIRAQMKDCTPPKPIEEPKKEVASAPLVPAVVAAPVQNVPGVTACIEMSSQLALTRLKTRIDPVISLELRNYLKSSQEVIARLKVRINESGDVAITGKPNGNPMVNQAVSTAVAQWKFTPTRDQNGARCVDTELSIIIRLAQ